MYSLIRTVIYRILQVRKTRLRISIIIPGRTINFISIQVQIALNYKYKKFISSSFRRQCSILLQRKVNYQGQTVMHSFIRKFLEKFSSIHARKVVADAKTQTRSRGVPAILCGRLQMFPGKRNLVSNVCYVLEGYSSCYTSLYVTPTQHV